MATITIDLPDQYIPILRQWASVSRTLNSAIKLLDIPSADPAEDDLRQFIQAELQALEPALNALHVATRTQIWKGV